MMALPKTMKNANVREISQIIYRSKGLDESFDCVPLLLPKLLATSSLVENTLPSPYRVY